MPVTLKIGNMQLVIIFSKMLKKKKRSEISLKQTSTPV